MRKGKNAGGVYFALYKEIRNKKLLLMWGGDPSLKMSAS